MCGSKLSSHVKRGKDTHGTIRPELSSHFIRGKDTHGTHKARVRRTKFACYTWEGKDIRKDTHAKFA